MDVAVSDDDAADLMIRHCITEGLLREMPQVDVIQLRAKTLDAGELLKRAVRLRGLFGGTLLVNDRVDVCLAAGADGVHLPSSRVAPNVLKRRFGLRLVVGVSCHTLDEVLRAEQEGADYVYLSPIFESLSKPGYGPALGLGVLGEVASRVLVPVIALGGVTVGNEAACVAAGAAGVAGISYFNQ